MNVFATTNLDLVTEILHIQAASFRHRQCFEYQKNKLVLWWHEMGNIYWNVKSFFSRFFDLILLNLRDRWPTGQRQSLGGNWPPSKFLCQVERRFHSQESNRQPFPWDLGISPPSLISSGSSRTIGPHVGTSNLDECTDSLITKLIFTHLTGATNTLRHQLQVCEIQ